MQYTDENRGTIQFKGRARQVITYDGMTFNKISPTDVDGLIEYRGKAYIVYEVKYDGAEMSQGQKLALTRMADDFKSAGKEAVLLICEHHNSAQTDVLLADTVVRELYYNGKFHRPQAKRTAKEWTDRFIRHVEGEKKI